VVVEAGQFLINGWPVVICTMLPPAVCPGCRRADGCAAMLVAALPAVVCRDDRAGATLHAPLTLISKQPVA
jgi:hypothetical protein